MSKTAKDDAAKTAAAQARAIISAYLNNITVPECTDEIYDALKQKFDDLGINKKSASYYMKNLADNGMILCTRDGIRNFYIGKANKAITSTEKSKKVDVKIRSLKEGDIPSYKIDVVKGQNRIRITMSNVMFDIGVVDA